MPAPDYSGGVPRGVVEARRADAGLTMPPGFSSTCTDCPAVGGALELSTPCGFGACPGVFVPILEDEPPKCETCGDGEGVLVTEGPGPDEVNLYPCPECEQPVLPRDFELERVTTNQTPSVPDAAEIAAQDHSKGDDDFEPEPSTGGARERIEAFLDEYARRMGQPRPKVGDEIHGLGTAGESLILMHSDLRSLLGDLDAAKAEAERLRGQGADCTSIGHIKRLHGDGAPDSIPRLMGWSRREIERLRADLDAAKARGDELAFQVWAEARAGQVNAGATPDEIHVDGRYALAAVGALGRHARKLRAELDAAKADLERERARSERLDRYLYNAGYMAGHEATVEGRFTDIVTADMFDYHAEEAAELRATLSGEEDGNG